MSFTPTIEQLKDYFSHPLPWKQDSLIAQWNHYKYQQLSILGQKPRQASVLVPLIVNPKGIDILLTVRASHLAHHPGQISFPGGRIEANETSQQAALRETWEEVGISPDGVEVLGNLPTLLTASNFVIEPFVGVVSSDVPLSLNTDEVSAVFSISLSFLLESRNFKCVQRKVDEAISKIYYFLQWNQYHIWGATAAILRNLSLFIQAHQQPNLK